MILLLFNWCNLITNPVIFNQCVLGGFYTSYGFSFKKITKLYFTTYSTIRNDKILFVRIKLVSCD